ncbi:MAG: hypothetical protein WKF71_19920 [Pyrinomonadaceae bacterium]
MNEWLPTLSLALGSAWTSGINLYATVTVLGLVTKIWRDETARRLRCAG